MTEGSIEKYLSIATIVLALLLKLRSFRWSVPHSAKKSLPDLDKQKIQTMYSCVEKCYYVVY